MHDSKRFRVDDLFDIIKRGKRIRSSDRIAGDLPFVTAGLGEMGISSYINRSQTEIFPKDSLTIDMFGSVLYRGYEFGADDHVAVLHNTQGVYSKRILQYIQPHIEKAIAGRYDYSRNFYASDAPDIEIELPVDEKGKIDFPYMENRIRELEAERIRELEAERIRELEAYLKVTGLSDYTLTPAEQAVLAEFRERERERESRLAPFRIGDLFTNIQQGSRLTKNDQRTGDLAFVMSGITNTGLVSHISNPVPTFQENAITVDIFGNTFYRGYSFAASDDVGVLWNQDNRFNQYHLLYLTSVISKRLSGLFDYSHKLRASQLSPYEVLLPVDSKGGVDLNFMELYIRAQQKLAIKGVVRWREKYISTTRQIAMA